MGRIRVGGMGGLIVRSMMRIRGSVHHLAAPAQHAHHGKHCQVLIACTALAVQLVQQNHRPDRVGPAETSRAAIAASIACPVPSL